ncbi:hypothetical protein [Fodinicola feengrottensis]|uniref:hypothetical protein n=1 Tax=Fodinicola feengrottensis TaxID=435914 RepID=UPI0024428C64|nr:hypothetical protein [Fodinicola feengrottensis]
MSSPVVLGGIVNVDEMDCSARGFAGLTFRVFDLATSQWSIYWVNNHRGQLEPPVVGGFSDGVGLFHGDDTLPGPVDPGPLHLVRDHRHLGPLGAGVLRRPRRDLGNQLDGRTHPYQLTARPRR